MKNKNQDLVIAETRVSSNCTNYIGTVTISVFQNERLLSKQTDHNAGMNNLFSFIANCLAGNWTTAKSTKPCKLALLRQAEGEDLKTSTPTATTSYKYWETKYFVANPIIYDTAALNTASDTQGSVTYHFRVPFLSLLSGAKVHKLLLLPSESTKVTSDACAYFILKEGINIPEIGGNYTIIVDWTLTFQNGGN